ncbi:MAG: class I SAM-dependent methyltransferase [Euryarchaeota archaeon]|nr:class I SAM-dependent methyltransferase [Euryarchaeota archaeon]
MQTADRYIVALDKELVNQLRRQSLWLRDSWLWLLREKGISGSALDLGCGPGLVMEALGGRLDITGLDSDPDMVAMCRAKGLTAVEGIAGSLPFGDSSFDVVYCSFLLLWVKEPAQVVREMARVSRRFVVCLAEPDYGARINHPAQVERLNDMLCEGIRAKGGDPQVGRKLRTVFKRAGVEAQIGAHAGVWDVETMRREMEGEWRFIEGTAAFGSDAERLELKRIWEESVEQGEMLLYNPFFYAVGEKR